MVAFQFQLVSVLPKLAYFTVIDRFIMGSTVLVFLALIEAVGASYMVAQKRTQIAVKMDAVSRWVFPGAFLVLSLWVFLM